MSYGAPAITRYFSASDRKANTDTANFSELALYMNKHKHLPSINPGEEWKITYYTNKVLLSTVILHYIFTNDDGVVSKTEIRMTDKFLKKNRLFFSEKDSAIFASLPNPYSKEDLLKYMADHKMQNSIFNDALKTVKEVIKKDYVYRNILSNLSVYIHENSK